MKIQIINAVQFFEGISKGTFEASPSPNQKDMFRVITYILKWPTDKAKLRYEKDTPMPWREYRRGQFGLKISTENFYEEG